MRLITGSACNDEREKLFSLSGALAGRKKNGNECAQEKKKKEKQDINRRKRKVSKAKRKELPGQKVPTCVHNMHGITESERPKGVLRSTDDGNSLCF